MTTKTVKTKILIVDDEERMVRFIRLNLEHDGFEVEEAFNGRQALDKLRQTLPDLIILDVMMPDLSGFEVLRMIRETNDVPVIMLTARHYLEDESETANYAHMFDEYVVKPFVVRDLMGKINKLIEVGSA